MILEVKGLEAKYGMSQALFGIDLNLEKAESVCVLGRNGVGKSTTLNSIMGVVTPSKGSVIFNGVDLAGQPAYKIARQGMTLVPQGRHIYPNLTVKENLIISKRKSVEGETEWDFDKIYELFPILKTRSNQAGVLLSGGEQQMLAIARGLMQNPRLLILDEICEGLAPIVCQMLMEVIQELRNRGVSILIAEQSVKFAMSVSDRCYIIEKGSVVYHGRTGEIPEDIIVKYLSA